MHIPWRPKTMNTDPKKTVCQLFWWALPLPREKVMFFSVFKLSLCHLRTRCFKKLLIHLDIFGRGGKLTLRNNQSHFGGDPAHSQIQEFFMDFFLIISFIPWFSPTRCTSTFIINKSDETHYLRCLCCFYLSWMSKHVRKWSNAVSQNYFSATSLLWSCFLFFSLLGAVNA